MKKVIWIAIVLMALLASPVWAQTTGSWNFGVDVGLKPKVHTSSIGQADGKSLDLTRENKTPWAVYLGYKPVDRFGAEVRFKTLGTKGQAAGFASGPLVIWGSDVAPTIVSSSPITRGPQNYTASTSEKFVQADFLGNRTWGLTGGAVSVFAGLSWVKVESNEDVGVMQKFLLTSRLPSGAIDSTAIGETYTGVSSADGSYRGFGPTFGVEAEKCIIAGLIVEGRAAVTFLPWGSNDGIGQFVYIKDIYLVNTVEGINGNPRQTIGHLNLAPNQGQFNDPSKRTGRVLDLKGVLKWRIHLGDIAIDVGGGVSRVSFTGQGVPNYVVPAAFSAGQGNWQSRSASLSVLNPMVTLGVWF